MQGQLLYQSLDSGTSELTIGIENHFVIREWPLFQEPWLVIKLRRAAKAKCG